MVAITAAELKIINTTRTTTLHPQLDEMVEQFSRTLLQHLSEVVDEHQKDWDHYIPLFMSSYRSVIHENTQHTPAKVILGHELKLPFDLKFGPPPEKPTFINKFVMEMTKSLWRTYTIVKNQLYLASVQVKTYYDIRVVMRTNWLFQLID